ncbi:MAG: methyltransferase domain-containing protein [Bacteroidota bacterium]
MNEQVDCPYCHSNESTPWAKENGYVAVKCNDCGFVYVNPRPQQSFIKESVKEGVHAYLSKPRSKITHRMNSKINLYSKIFRMMCPELSKQRKPIKWLDVGAGFGEVVQAVMSFAPEGSYIMGVEPMIAKAETARSKGINVVHGYVDDIKQKFDFVSVINVFSHIPNISEFIKNCYNVLDVQGEIIMETGNIGDLTSSAEVPTELDLPDHLIFAGEKHIVGFLEQAGFKVISTKAYRRDTFVNLLKNVVKKLLGRSVTIRMPYTSPYRTIIVRAKK